MTAATHALASVSLDDKYTSTDGRVYLSGIQALVRLMLVQKWRDQAAGLKTAGFVSGYRGSPLGGIDEAFHTLLDQPYGPALVVVLGVGLIVFGVYGLAEAIDSVGIDGLPAPFQTLMTDLLPDWYDDWLGVERDRLRLLRLAALEKRAREFFAVGDTTSAIQFGLAALAIEGARESAHRLVVDAHLAEGNTCEARREQLRFERCLSEEFV